MIDKIIEKIFVNIPNIHLTLCIYVLISPVLIGYGLQNGLETFTRGIINSIIISLLLIFSIGLLCDCLKSLMKANTI